MFLLAFLLVNNLSAQQTYFIYLQNETKQPFAVIYNKKIYSSTPSGYLILPQLNNGLVSFTISFPKNIHPEQKFFTVLDKKDAGFLLKNFGEKGWGIFNLQSLSVTMANQSVPEILVKEEVSTLPQIVNNKPKEVKIDSVVVQPTDLEKADSSSLNIKPVKGNTIIDSTKKEVIDIAPLVPKEEIPPLIKKKETGIVKTFEISGSTGVDLIYVDYTTKPYDTVTVFIPSGIPEKSKASNSQESINKSGKKDQVDLVDDKKYYNQKCITIAVDADFMSLRKKMASETDDEKMVAAAKKAFKLKCYTTEQIKNLSWLFLNDKGKFMFFQASQPYVYDIPNFISLETQIGDDVYKQRFKALIK